MIGEGRRRRRQGHRTNGLRESALLLLLHRGPAHGYTLMEQLKEFGLGEIAPSVVYRVMRTMETLGWVVSTWDEEQTQGPPRRIYRITALGDKVLAAWVGELNETKEMLDHLVGAYHLHMEKGEGEYH
ncbi:MAG: helix-turn-helix transcriptional regulator [Anaerolineales bacterium]|nr:helix-turn-helix transcriptional regulator [Anaerolineales bacterium]